MKPITFSSFIEPIENKMAYHLIPVPDEVARQFVKGKGAPRILCSIEGTEEFPCALNPRHGRYVLIASLQLIRKHKLTPEKRFTLSIRTDPSNGLSLPEELAEVLAQDDEGLKCFEALNDGHKRGYIYYVNQPKSIDSRIKRALEIVEKIKLRSGG